MLKEFMPPPPPQKKLQTIPTLQFSSYGLADWPHLLLEYEIKSQN